MAIQLTDSIFEEEVLKCDIPVLVDFWAPWCGPCQAIGPIIDELAMEYVGRVKIVKMSVDKNQIFTSKYAVRAVPTLILFKNGEVIEQISGAVSKDTIKNMLDKKAL